MAVLTMRWAAIPLLALVVALGCAEELPGFAPPTDQLHFPVSVAVAGEHVLVVSSNFDQRYNAGSVMALPLSALGEAIPATATEPAIVRDLPATGRSQIKISSFGGRILVVPREAESEVYVATRRGNRLTRASFANGVLDCGNGAVTERVLGTDCTPARTISINGPETTVIGEDPFSLAFVPDGGPRGTVVVGHLSLSRRSADDTVPLGTLALVDPQAIDANIAAEADGTGGSTVSKNLFVIGLGGTSEMVVVPGTSQIVAAPAETGVDEASIASFSVTRTATGGLGIRRAGEVTVGRVTGADGARGLAVSADGQRAYVTLRLLHASNGGTAVLFNSALAVISLPDNRLLSITEVGEELGAIALVERADGQQARRLIYATDLRTDRIWVIDASNDSPVVVHVIEPAASAGAAQRWLSGPAQITVLSEASRALVGGRTLALVPNFANSTLAVLDLSDANPRRHRVVARFGRAMSDDGTEEVE